MKKFSIYQLLNRVMYQAYKQHSTLVSTEWLADKLKSNPANFRLLDASWHLPMMKRDPKKEYEEKHIPSALFFDVDECCDKETPYENMLPTATEFEQYVGTLGIDNNTEVVLYDSNLKFGLFSAPRVWWTFKVFGHSAVSILIGGLPRWLTEERETTVTVDSVEPKTYKAEFQANMVKSFEDINSQISSNSVNLFDGRPKGRFDGVSPEPREGILPGHVPGAKNIPFMSLLSMETANGMKPKEELKEIFTTAGVTSSSVAMCGSGIAACHLALAAHIADIGILPVYDGSWTEWYMRAPKELKENVPDST